MHEVWQRAARADEEIGGDNFGIQELAPVDDPDLPAQKQHSHILASQVTGPHSGSACLWRRMKYSTPESITSSESPERHSGWGGRA